MPTYRHAKTNVELNTIKIRKTHLTLEEEATVRELRSEGEEYHLIAARFGINQGRIAELLGPDPSKKADSQQPGLDF